MTGHTSYYAPFLELEPAYSSTERPMMDCHGTIAPVWGRVSHSHDSDEEYWYSSLIGNVSESYDDSYFPIIYHHPPYSIGSGPEWIDCKCSKDFLRVWLTSHATDYDRHKSVYSGCPSQLNISDCPAAEIETYLVVPAWWPTNVTLSPPVPGIVRYSDVSTSESKYSH